MLLRRTWSEVRGQPLSWATSELSLLVLLSALPSNSFSVHWSCGNSFIHSSLISSMTLECLLCTRRHRNKQAKTPALREIIPVNREHGVGVIAHVPGLIRFFLITAVVILIL